MSVGLGRKETLLVTLRKTSLMIGISARTNRNQCIDVDAA